MHGQLQTKIKALGIYQIIGGLFGIGLTFYLLNTNNSFTLLVFLIILFILGLYCYSIYSGIILIKNVEKGLTHSKVNQLFQLILSWPSDTATSIRVGFFFLWEWM